MLAQKWILCLVCLLPISAVQADYAVALGNKPKYAQDFSHFDYVNPDAPKGGEIVLYDLGGFDSLNPYVLKGISAAGLNMVFESLTIESQDEAFTAYGLLADDINLADDQLSVQFHINPDARFSDGSKVTATDVKFSFDTLVSQAAHPQYRIYWQDIKSSTVINEQTVQFDFKVKNRELFMIIGQMPVFPQHWVGDTAFNKLTKTIPIGSGPYLLKKYNWGKQVIYQRNPNYWAKDLNVRKGQYNFDKVTYRYYKDATITLEAMKAGEFDVMDIYMSKQWSRDLVGPVFKQKKILKAQLPHSNNAGMQAFAFNLRRPLFQDIRVRQALNLAFDFEWTNKHLFFNAYQRCHSFFSNSELAATDLPDAAETKLLKQLQKTYPNDFPNSSLTDVWQADSTAKPNSLRQNLRKAKALLTEAGWHLPAGKQILENAQGDKFHFEVILVQKAFERIMAPFVRNLNKLGIEISYRTVDAALYKRRSDNFDYDMLVASFPQSLSPGNEQFSMWHSDSAKKIGSQNVIGLANPVIDSLLEKLTQAPNRTDLLTIAHALDRVLLHGYYVIPQWYIPVHRVIYWDKFGQPDIDPLYYSQVQKRALESWWQRPKNLQN